MAYDSFKIKYLFEIFPDVDFEDELLCTQTVQRLPNTADVIATPDLWGDIRSTIKRSRKIQSTIYENYEVKIIFSRNIDLSVLDYAEYTTLETLDGDSFLIYDVNVEMTKISGGLNYTALITFKKEADQLVYHASSDNAYSYYYKYFTPVNNIEYTVNNPSYSFNNVEIVTVYISAIFRYQTAFVISNPKIDYTLFTVGQGYYLHTDNPTFNNIENAATSSNFTYAEVYSASSAAVTFILYSGSSDPGTDPSYIISNVILDHVPDERDLPSGETVDDETITPKIYTFIEPKYSHESIPEEGNEYDTGTEENKYSIEKDIAKFKVWLKEEEKWKAEYLNYALAENIEINLKNQDDILPSQTKGIITPLENDRLVDLFEYDIKVVYNVKRVDLTE